MYVRLSLSVSVILSACIIVPPTETICVEINTGDFCENTGYTQKNGAVSKVSKKFISHLTRTQRTPSAAATVQISHALPAARFSCLLRGRGASFQDGVASGKGFLCTAGASFLNRARNSRCTVITDLDTTKRSTQKACSK